MTRGPAAPDDTSACMIPTLSNAGFTNAQHTDPLAPLGMPLWSTTLAGAGLRNSKAFIDGTVDVLEAHTRGQLVGSQRNTSELRSKYGHVRQVLSLRSP